MMIEIFADTSNIEEIKDLNRNPLIRGFTTNPTLMKKAGIVDYEKFCKEVLEITDKPVSFEVFADDFDEMERQAKIISSWGKNVYVKIPITNTKGESSKDLVLKLLEENIKVNITAITTIEQFRIFKQINTKTPFIISYFAGRVADTGIDPVAVLYGEYFDKPAELLWASSREILNIKDADLAGCNIITCTPELIKKYEKFKDMDLNELSLLTVRQFYEDAQLAGYKL